MVTRTRKRTRRTRQRTNRDRKTYHKKSKTKHRSRNIRKKHKSIKGGGLSEKLMNKIYIDNLLPMFEEYLGQPPSADQLRRLSGMDDAEFVAAISAMEPKFSFDPHEAAEIHKWVRNLPKKELVEFAYDLIGKVKSKIGLKIKLPPSLIKQVARRQQSRSQQSRDSGNLMNDVLSSLNILQSSRGGTGDAITTQHGGADLGVTIFCILMIALFASAPLAMLFIFISNKRDDWRRSRAGRAPPSLEAAAAAAAARADPPEAVPPRAASLRVPPRDPSLLEKNKTSLSEEDQRKLLDTMEEEDCAICSENLKSERGWIPGDSNDVTRKQDDIVILKCEHKYHKDCVMRLHGLPFSCPMCRTLLGDWSQIDKNVIFQESDQAQP